MQVVIRKATANDALAIALVHVRSWQVAYRGLLPDEVLDNLEVEERAKLWRELAQQPDKIIIVAAEAESTLVGFCAVGHSRDADANSRTAEISAIYVHPDNWRSGIGRELLVATLAEVRKHEFDQVTLWVLETNQRARSFYETLAFVHDGTIKDDDHWKSFRVRELRYRVNLHQPENHL